MANLSKLSEFLSDWLPERGSRTSTGLLTGAGVILLLGTSWTIQHARLWHARRQVRQKRLQRQRDRQAALDELEGKLSHLTLTGCEQITKLPMTVLRQMIKDGELTALEVLHAFQFKALQVHKKTNCLIEPVKEAEAAAAALDKDSDFPMLAGIPISIKDDLGIKGYNSVAGVSCRIGEISTEDSAIVETMKHYGAIPFCKTDSPVMAFSLEGGNNVYGVVRNPYDPTRGSGGSSSGEAALVGGGGSLAGFGSDIGGSIRNPSCFSGICGFKPTSFRMSKKGVPGYKRVNDISIDIANTWGPFTRDVDSIVLVMKALWDGYMFSIDPLIVPLKFNNEMYEDKRKLRIGYFFDTTLIPTTPVCRRAVNMAKQVLEKNGHTLVPWTPPDLDNIMDLEFNIIFSDRGAGIRDLLKYEDEVHVSVLPFFGWAMSNRIVRWLRAKVLPCLIPDKADFLKRCLLGYKDVASYNMDQKAIKDLRRKVAKDWLEMNLDAVICPSFPYPALPFGNALILIMSAACLMQFNVLDYPAGNVRMTKVTSEDIENMADYPADDKYLRIIHEGMKGAEGLPMGVQVAALQYRDELCLRVMKEVEAAADYTVV